MRHDSNDEFAELLLESPAAALPEHQACSDSLFILWRDEHGTTRVRAEILPAAVCIHTILEEDGGTRWVLVREYRTEPTVSRFKGLHAKLSKAREDQVAKAHEYLVEGAMVFLKRMAEGKTRP